jgi:hypothetical protein
MAAADRLSSVALPTAKRTGGGSGIGRSSAGYSASSGTSIWAPIRAAASTIFLPASSGVAFVAVATARLKPGKALKNAIGAEWAPSEVMQAVSRVFNRAAPMPGTWVSAR